MVEILPIKLLQQSDAQIFGSLNLQLAKLRRLNLPVVDGFIVSPPDLKLKTVLEHYDFGSKEIFEQSLALVKKELENIQTPEILVKEVGKEDKFWVSEADTKGVKNLWIQLLGIWIQEIKLRLWKDGFSPGLTENLEPQVVVFIDDITSFGQVYFDPLSDDTVIETKSGTISPENSKQLDELVKEANKRLFIPHVYSFILDGSLKITKVSLYTPIFDQRVDRNLDLSKQRQSKIRSVVKVFANLDTNEIADHESIDGAYLSAEKIINLNDLKNTTEDLTWRLLQSAKDLPNKPVLFKLADIRQSQAGLRGSFRLLHQQNLFDSLCQIYTYVRHKRGLINVHLVVPFVRTPIEFIQIKRNLSVKKITRKNSLQLWMEVAVPENIINLENYLIAGLDGVVLNLDEIASFLSGYDTEQENLTFYKNEVSGLIKFIEDGLKILHKSKVPFLATGSISLYPDVLEFLVEKGVYGVVAPEYENSSIRNLLNFTEKRVILRKAEYTHL